MSMILLNKVLTAHKEDAFVSFKASTKRLVAKELNDLNKGKDLSYIRGTVEVKKMISYNFGFPIYEVLFKETNVSFGRFEKEIINQVDWDKIWVSY